jgi:Family of unknown function (DUF6545)
VNSALSLAVFALLGGVLLVRLPTVLRGARQRALWATCFTLALCKVTALPAVNGKLLSLTDSAQIIPHVFGIACVFFLMRFISLITDHYAAHPRAAVYQLVAAGTVAVLLIVVAGLAPHGISTAEPELVAGAVPPLVVVYWVLLDTYLGGMLAAATVQFWRMSRDAPPGALRIGLRCIVVGLFLTALYAAQKVGFVVAHGFGATVPARLAGPVFDGIRTMGAILAVGGALVPATGWIRSVIRAYRSLPALRPLWETMRRAFPGIILFSTRRALVERFGVDDVHLRLYRRVIEIRDGLLVLRDHLPSDAGPAATGYLDAQVPAGSGVDRAALAEACCITLALDRQRSGCPPDGDGRWARVGDDLADEVGWMRKVAACLHRPEPAGFVAWWAARHPEDLAAPDLAARE